MYYHAPNVSAARGLGFSLKPPSWLTNIFNATQTGISTAQAAADETRRILVAAGGTQPYGVPAVTTPTQLRVGGDAALPGWVLPAAVIGLAFVLLKDRR
jgi:hypothetical protein